MTELSPEQIEALQKQKDNCPFCKIIAGEIPSKQVYEDEDVIALLDIHPSTNGHLLVMPKEHYPIMPLIPEKTFTKLFQIVSQLSEKLKKSMLVSRNSIFIANGYAAGQNSQHFLLHIIPREKDDNLYKLYPKEDNLDEKEYQEVYKIISNNLPIMLRNRYKLFPIPGKDQLKPRYNIDQVKNIIEQNPQLKALLQSNPNEFRKLAKSHDQLKPIFEQIDVDELIRNYIPGYEFIDGQNTEQNLEGREEEKEQEEKEEKNNIQKDEGQSPDNEYENLIQILEENPKLKQMLIENPEEFKDKVETVQKLNDIFGEVDINILRKKIMSINKKDYNSENDEQIDEENGSDDDEDYNSDHGSSDLDDISKLL